MVRRCRSGRMTKKERQKMKRIRKRRTHPCILCFNGLPPFLADPCSEFTPPHPPPPPPILHTLTAGLGQATSLPRERVREFQSEAQKYLQQQQGGGGGLHASQSMGAGGAGLHPAAAHAAAPSGVHGMHPAQHAQHAPMYGSSVGSIDMEDASKAIELVRFGGGWVGVRWRWCVRVGGVGVSMRGGLKYVCVCGVLGCGARG